MDNRNEISGGENPATGSFNVIVDPNAQTVATPPPARKPVKRIAIKILIGVGALVIIIGAWFLLAHYLPTRSTVKNGDIKIGDITITKTERAAYKKQLDDFLKANPGSTFGSSSTADIADDDLILNAALKTKAKDQCGGVTVSNDDLLNRLGNPGNANDSLSNRVKNALGTKTDFRYIRQENAVFEEKLESCLIASNKKIKAIFTVSISYTAPYFYMKKGDERTKAYAAAEKILSDKFLPLFKSGESKAKIAALTDIDTLNPDKTKKPNYYDGPVTRANYITGFSNDYYKDDVSAPEGLETEDTDAKINALNKVGDCTGVFAAKDGDFMIARVEKMVGSGTYKSWEAFLEAEKDAAAYTPLSKIIGWVGRGIRDSWNAFAAVFGDRAAALIANITDSGGHTGTYSDPFDGPVDFIKTGDQGGGTVCPNGVTVKFLAGSETNYTAGAYFKKGEGTIYYAQQDNDENDPCVLGDVSHYFDNGGQPAPEVSLTTTVYSPSFNISIASDPLADAKCSWYISGLSLAVVYQDGTSKSIPLGVKSSVDIVGALGGDLVTIGQSATITVTAMFNDDLTSCANGQSGSDSSYGGGGDPRNNVITWVDTETETAQYDGNYDKVSRWPAGKTAGNNGASARFASSYVQCITPGVMIYATTIPLPPPGGASAGGVFSQYTYGRWGPYSKNYYRLCQSNYNYHQGTMGKLGNGYRIPISDPRYVSKKDASGKYLDYCQKAEISVGWSVNSWMMVSGYATTGLQPGGGTTAYSTPACFHVPYLYKIELALPSNTAVDDDGNNIQIGDSISIGKGSVKTTENVHLASVSGVANNDDGKCANQRYYVLRAVVHKGEAALANNEFTTTLPGGKTAQQVQQGSVDCQPGNNSTAQTVVTNDIKVEAREGEGLTPGDQVCYALSVSNWTNDPYDDTDRVTNDNAPGNIGTPNGRYRNTSWRCYSVVKRSNIAIKGADSVAGGAYDCTIDRQDWGFDATVPRGRQGSFSQYGLFSAGRISTNFGSAGWLGSYGDNNTGNLANSRSLKFSNGLSGNTYSNGETLLDPGTSGEYDGNFAGRYCLSDYWDYYSGLLNGKNSAVGSWQLSGDGTDVKDSIDIDGEKIYLVDHNFELSSLNLKVGQKIVLLVGGTLTLNGDINFPTSFDSIYDIPGFTAIASDDIIVDPSVHRLDGNFATKKVFRDCGDFTDDTSGIAVGGQLDYEKTCATAGGWNSTATGLVINGSLAVGGARFQRTNSAVNISDETGIYGEIINYSPAEYLEEFANSTAARQDVKTILYREVAPRF